jgi:hypothetical protein
MSTKTPNSQRTKRRSAKNLNRYPKGLNRCKVQAIIDHYESQTPSQATAEDEAAYHKNTITMMAVPIRLVPQVQALIAKRSG